MPHSESLRARRRLSLADRLLRPAFQAVLIAMGLALLSLAACGGSRPSPETSQPTAAEKAYLQNIQVTGAEMTAAKNFLQHTVTTLHAHVTNHGRQTVRYVELELSFTNFMGQVDLREKAHPINTGTPPLRPGETRDFEVSFDHVPDDWNQAPPQINVNRVVLAENK